MAVYSPSRSESIIMVKSSGESKGELYLFSWKINTFPKYKERNSSSRIHL